MIQVYPHQTSDTLFDFLDMPFFIYYVASMYLPNIDTSRLEIYWEPVNYGRWLGMCVTQVDNRERIEVYGQPTAGSLLNTLLHELIHVDQLHGGRLHYRNGHVFWQKSLFRRPKKQRRSHVFYMQQPWEVEARQLTSELSVKLHLDGVIDLKRI